MMLDDDDDYDFVGVSVDVFQWRCQLSFWEVTPPPREASYSLLYPWLLGAGFLSLAEVSLLYFTHCFSWPQPCPCCFIIVSFVVVICITVVIRSRLRLRCRIVISVDDD